jgi:DNA-binding transcriptional ArsR family regulator
VSRVPDPLYLRTAGFFRTLGHPVRVRVLEVLASGPLNVRQLLDEAGGEASSMSQQLAVLRQAGIIRKLPDGRYRLAAPEVVNLMQTARGILASLLVSQHELLDALREETNSAKPDLGAVTSQ